MNIVFAIPTFSTGSKSEEGRKLQKLIEACALKVGKATVNTKRGVAIFEIDRAFNMHSSDKKNIAALQALMECLCHLDYLYLKSHPFIAPLYHSGVYYERTIIWDTTPALYGRGFGDCKSLAACRVAELWRAGIWCRPVFRFQRAKQTMFHILLMFANGTFEDPSKALGMIPPQEMANHG
jgi:hypothetical protein